MLGGTSSGGAMPVGEVLDDIGKAAEQMSAISHLNGIRRALTDSLGMNAVTVTRYDLDTRMSTQLRANSRCLAVWQQIDNLVRFQVDQDRAVVVARSPDPVVDPKNPGRRWGRSSGRWHRRRQTPVATAYPGWWEWRAEW